MEKENKMEKKLIKWIALSTAVILVMIFTVIAQDGTAEDQTEAAVSVDQSEEAPVGQDVEMVIDIDTEDSGTPSIQSIQFGEDCSIKRALVILGALYKKNIVPSAKIEDGPVQVSSLYDVTFEEALQAIIGENKYLVSDNGNFIQVYTREEYQGKLKPYVRNLNYVTAQEVEKIITPLLSSNGTIASTTPAAQDTQAGKGGDSVAIRDTIVIKDFQENINEIDEAINEIDIQPKQVLIEVTILEAELDETTQFGIDFNVMGLTQAIGSDGISVDGFASRPSNGVLQGFSAGIVQDKVETFITALENITDTTVLANPKIMALNKQAGKLLIGNEDGYLTTTLTNAEGAMQEVAFLESGTKLEFRPYITENKYIRLEIAPEQSTGNVRDVGNNTIPQKRTTTVQTNIMVESGKTIVLGGLFQEKTTLSRSQIPLLGDIPYIGEAFKKINDQSVRTELIVLITPHIIDNPQDADGANRLEDVNRMAYKARKNITWLSRTRRAEDRYEDAVRLYREGKKDEALGQLNRMFETTRNYLEIERLRDKIIKDKFPGHKDSIQRVMLQKFQEEESAKWYRQLKNSSVTCDLINEEEEK